MEPIGGYVYRCVHTDVREATKFQALIDTYIRTIRTQSNHEHHPPYSQQIYLINSQLRKEEKNEYR